MTPFRFDRLRSFVAIVTTFSVGASCSACGSADHKPAPPTQETRVVDLIEGLKTPASAIALGKRLGTGRSFERRAMREVVNRTTNAEETGNFNAHLVQAIFAAPLNEMAGPVQYAGHWVILVVRRAYSQ